MDKQQFLEKFEELQKPANAERWAVLQLWLVEAKSDEEIAKVLVKTRSTATRKIINICKHFGTDIWGDGEQRKQLVYLFRKYCSDFEVHSSIYPDWVDGDSSDLPQSPTNPKNILTTTVTDNLPIPSDQEDLEIDSSISSWVSEKSYNKFIARDFDLKKLIEYTENGISSKVLSIWGMGGLGKTATCHRLISLLYSQKRFKKIVWINAKRKQFQASEGKSEQIRESRLDIQDAILDIGKELNLDAWFVQDIDRLQREISKLFMQESHLLIVDGLEDAESPKLLISHLRRILGKSSLFLTSRKQISLENGFEYRLSELDRKSSLI